ncbi:MAG: hypothetical protein CVU69_02650 [Deltaproteobacteria bacterium HGW-Deltaproteobacteria-4]|nr:MAG: hypothetical protein CVU69_02650 [Deltaproteobacteria bacterium HGW-Deltaproteobacteria-4]
MVASEILEQTERSIEENPNIPLCKLFSSWDIKDYASLYFSDLTVYPSLQRRLPKMPPADIQRHWNWFSDKELMERSVLFSKNIKETYESITGRSLADASVLDYGAGWGRLTRMMLQFVPGSRVHACDADPKSINLYNSLGFENICQKVSPVPVELPFAQRSYDLVWLWSILTHLPDKATDAVMNSLHPIMTPHGMLLITIRPAKFWTENPLVDNKSVAQKMVEEHEVTGFAHNAQSPYWGDTSMSVDYIKQKWPQWAVSKVEDDGLHQIKVYLSPN